MLLRCTAALQQSGSPFEKKLYQKYAKFQRKMSYSRMDLLALHSTAHRDLVTAKSKYWAICSFAIYLTHSTHMRISKESHPIDSEPDLLLIYTTRSWLATHCTISHRRSYQHHSSLLLPFGPLPSHFRVPTQVLLKKEAILRLRQPPLALLIENRSVF